MPGHQLGCTVSKYQPTLRAPDKPAAPENAVIELLNI
jgi:hypothetical protein